MSATPIHVLHVVPGLIPGGMELGMARVIRGLSDMGMEHSVACLKGEPEISAHLPEKTRIHCLRSRPNEPQLPARLAGLIRRIRPTVIHARNWGAWPDVAVGRLLAPPIVPLICSFHGLGQAGYMPLRRCLASWLLARIATRLFTLSERSKRMLVTRWGWPEHRTAVIPNGVDTERFRPFPTSKRTERFVVGSVGNLRPVKNHALLVRACDDALRRGIDLELRIAGEGGERNTLLELAKSLGFGNRLSLAGRIEDIPDFLAHLDLFVLSSDSEQHPNALNEAMACGLASVATRVGCVQELLDDGRCGRIVPPGDEAAMAQAIAELAEDHGARDDLGEKARHRVCEVYSLQRMLAAYERLYRETSRT